VDVALELCGLTKRFRVGSGGCVASADVLRGIDLRVMAGETMAVVGPTGSGKSTLLLCAAGLLTHEGGDARWFGADDRAVAARRAAYHCTASDLLLPRCPDGSMLHLLDVSFGIDSGRTIAGWIERRRAAGDAVMVATRDTDLAHHLAPRVVVLRGGRAYPAVRPTSRVAEFVSRESASGGRFVDHSFGDA
jgi:ABC-type uncharacterized transport system ATPase component